MLLHPWLPISPRNDISDTAAAKPVVFRLMRARNHSVLFGNWKSAEATRLDALVFTESAAGAFRNDSFAQKSGDVHERGYPAWIRTKNNASKGRCVTVTPRGNRLLRMIPARHAGRQPRLQLVCKSPSAICKSHVKRCEFCYSAGLGKRISTVVPLPSTLDKEILPP